MPTITKPGTIKNFISTHGKLCEVGKHNIDKIDFNINSLGSPEYIVTSPAFVVEVCACFVETVEYLEE